MGKARNNFFSPKRGGTFRPSLQFRFIGAFPFVQQTEDAEALSEFQFGSKLLDGFLPLFDFLLIFQMSPHPVGQPGFPQAGACAVDVLEQRVRAEYIQIERVEMGGVDKLFSAIESGSVVVEGCQFLFVDFHFLFQIIFPVEQAVVVFDEQQEGQEGDEDDAGRYLPAFGPKINHSRYSADE